MGSLLLIILMLLNVVFWIVIAHIIMSWLINFQVLNPREPFVGQVWYTLNRLVEPVYSRIRRFIPPTAGLDFAPLIVILAIYALRIIISRNLIYFA